MVIIFMVLWTQPGGLWVRNHSVLCGGCTSGLGEHLARLGSWKSLSGSFHEAGGLGLLRLGLLAGASWVQIWIVCISTNKWAANNEDTSPWPESITRELYRSSGRIPSHSTFKEPPPWQWGGREKQWSRITEARVPFPVLPASELYHLWGKLFKLCLTVHVCYVKMAISLSQIYY